MRTFPALLAVALTVTLAACGGSSSADTSAPKAPVSSTPASVAKQIGCTDVKARTGQLELYTKASATCTLGGTSYLVDTFATTADRDAFVKVAKQMGALGDYKSGADWVAYPV